MADRQNKCYEPIEFMALVETITPYSDLDLEDTLKIIAQVYQKNNDKIKEFATRENTEKIIRPEQAMTWEASPQSPLPPQPSVSARYPNNSI